MITPAETVSLVVGAGAIGWAAGAAYYVVRRVLWTVLT